MARWFGSQGHKTRIFVKKVSICRPVTVAGFPLTYIYVGRVPKVLNFFFGYKVLPK